jgi:cell division septation protein DedD
VDFVNAQTVSLDGSSVGHIQLSAYGMGSGDAGITIQNNVISGGISLGNSGTNKIGGNTINGAAIGIDDQTDYVSWHAPAGNNQIVGNTITNSQIGIKIRSAQMYSTPDTVIQNTIKNCAVGVQIVFKDAPVVIQNSFSLNSFIDNGIQVNCTGPNSDIWSTGTPLKGNYWSDYKGVDANGDGIGDTPYTINAANKDNYPLMYPYGTTPPAPTPTALPTPTTTVTPTPTAVPTPTQTTTHANPSPTPTTNPTTAPTMIPTPTAQPTSNPTSNPTADPISQNQNVIPETNFYWAGLLMLAAGISAIFLARKSLTKQPTL